MLLQYFHWQVSQPVWSSSVIAENVANQSEVCLHLRLILPVLWLPNTVRSAFWKYELRYDSLLKEHAFRIPSSALLYLRIWSFLCHNSDMTDFSPSNFTVSSTLNSPSASTDISCIRLLTSACRINGVSEQRPYRALLQIIVRNPFPL